MKKKVTLFISLFVYWHMKTMDAVRACKRLKLKGLCEVLTVCTLTCAAGSEH